MQRINLYRESLSRTPSSAAGRQLLVAACAALVLALAWYGWSRWELEQARSELARLGAEQSELEARVARVEAELRQRAASGVLDREAERLQQELAAKRAVLAVLSSDQAGNRQGFSAHLEGLARRPVTGLWLTGITIGAGGARLGLEGSVLEADLLPRFLEAIGREPTFAGHEFQTLRMLREEGGRRLDFAVRTVPEGR